LSSRESAPALRGEPQTHIDEAVEVKEYQLLLISFYKHS
jgi:hypothetical protein